MLWIDLAELCRELRFTLGLGTNLSENHGQTLIQIVRKFELSTGF